MEKNVYDKLSTEQKELLGTLYESKSMRAILEANNNYQLLKAQHVATQSPDFENVLINRGNIQGARFIYDLCRYANSKMKKAE